MTCHIINVTKNFIIPKGTVKNFQYLINGSTVHINNI